MTTRFPGRRRYHRGGLECRDEGCTRLARQPSPMRPKRGITVRRAGHVYAPNCEARAGLQPQPARMRGELIEVGEGASSRRGGDLARYRARASFRAL
jgi:hypothetical protein